MFSFTDNFINNLYCITLFLVFTDLHLVIFTWIIMYIWIVPKSFLEFLFFILFIPLFVTFFYLGSILVCTFLQYLVYLAFG